MAKSPLSQSIWRWHFYAGLFVIPFILILSVTGAIYLFKPQIDRWEESAWRGLPTQNSVSADAQLNAALAQHPGATFVSYRLPQAPGDAAVVRLSLGKRDKRDVYIAPSGDYLASVRPKDRISSTVSHIHGSLLLGKWGSYLVELAASWAIIMILTGLYLWWPRARSGGPRLAGVLWPRWGQKGKRLFWRDLHSVTGFWVSGLALVLLFSGLPWTELWGDGFRTVRTEMGWTDAKPQQWKNGEAAAGQQDDHSAHLHEPASTKPNEAVPASNQPKLSLQQVAAIAVRQKLPFPAIIQPPGAPAKFGPPNGPDWLATTETQNRPEQRKIWIDARTGDVTKREGFDDQHAIDQVVGYGIAWHEGQLFGWVNQLVGVLTALALILVAVSGTIMWWRRRPQGTLGAPPQPPAHKQRGFIALMIVAGFMLPMLGLSLLAVLLLELLRYLAKRVISPPQRGG
ncbi:PepSY-associated TM helix domain-containing protein [Sphingorhabdus arenilitoris]|uniref:PepSY-associated TM helix domain-containing protein n=1 Tax=Sphingorhabdus arenilitoris TaxID=1490041 RepID=A0ABV8RC44_9SPHN